MNPLRYRVQTVITALLFVLCAAQLCTAQQPTFTPYKASGIYAVGEKVGWTATLPPGAAPTPASTYEVRKNNQDVLKTGTLDFSSGRAVIETTLDEPAMVYVQVSNGPALGAAVAP